MRRRCSFTARAHAVGSAEAEAAGAALEQLAHAVEGAAEDRRRRATSSTQISTGPRPSATAVTTAKAATPASSAECERKPARCSRSASSPPPSEASTSPPATRSSPCSPPLRKPQTITTMPIRITSSDSGKLPQGAARALRAAGRPGAAPRRGRGGAPRRARARVVSACRACGSCARPCQVANGQPELMTTRHQPISMPMKLQRGRTCQCLQPGSPMSSLRHPHPLVALGVEQHLLDQAPVLLLGVGALGERRGARAGRARPARRAAPRARPARAGAARRGPARPARSPCAARSSRTAAPAPPRAARPGRAACGARRARPEASAERRPAGKHLAAASTQIKCNSVSGG